VTSCVRDTEASSDYILYPGGDKLCTWYRG